MFKKFISITFLIVLSAHLSGCATAPSKLSADYNGRVLPTELVYLNTDNIYSTYQKSSATSSPAGGLIGIFVIAAVNAAADASNARDAAERQQALSATIKEFDIDRHVKSPTVDVITKSSWIDVKSSLEGKISLSPEHYVPKSSQEFVAVVRYSFELPSSQNLDSALMFNIYKKSDPKNAIYSLRFTESAFSPGAEPFDGKEATEWQDDGGESLKKAILSTSRKLRQRLAGALSNPFVAPK
jgi:hypothetical protein